MKKIITVLFVICLCISAKAQNFGAKVKDKGAISTKDLVTKMEGKESVDGKVSGVVESVCQVKGCWMKVKLDNGETMRVTFKDYGFFVPKDIAGKTVVFEGTAKVKTTSVADLQHYAEDAGKSKEEIAQIKAPEKALSFVANGVVVKD